MSSPADPTPASAPTPAPQPGPGTRVTALDSDPTEAWPQLHRRLNAVLHQRIEAADFLGRIGFIEDHLSDLAQARQDDSLFVLVQMLADRHYSYSATHALLSALVCTLMGPLAKIEGDELKALIRAALTMNIGMADLHDLLALQTSPPDTSQRERIETHPQTSVDILRQWGVEDPLWLRLVLEHHETPDGKGYPNHKVISDRVLQCLHMADIFVARISPRTSRRGLSPNVAVGNLYLESKEQDDLLGAIFVKQLGMYPPGTYVRLKSEETAVVVRRGDRVNTPMTMAIADANGMPLSTPGARDTQIPTYGIKGAVSPEDVKIRLDLSKLLKRR